jgi:hypothetical protein
VEAVDKPRLLSQFPLMGLWISLLVLSLLLCGGQSCARDVEEGEMCRHCGSPTGAIADARQRLVEAAIDYALATCPNGHPVDTEFRRAVSELTCRDRDDLRDDLGQPGVGEPR